MAKDVALIDPTSLHTKIAHLNAEAQRLAAFHTAFYQFAHYDRPSARLLQDALYIPNTLSTLSGDVRIDSATHIPWIAMKKLHYILDAANKSNDQNTKSRIANELYHDRDTLDTLLDAITLLQQTIQDQRTKLETLQRLYGTLQENSTLLDQLSEVPLQDDRLTVTDHISTMRHYIRNHTSTNLDDIPTTISISDNQIIDDLDTLIAAIEALGYSYAPERSLSNRKKYVIRELSRPIQTDTQDRVTITDEEPPLEITTFIDVYDAVGYFDTIAISHKITYDPNGHMLDERELVVIKVNHCKIKDRIPPESDGTIIIKPAFYIDAYANDLTTAYPSHNPSTNSDSVNETLLNKSKHFLQAHSLTLSKEIAATRLPVEPAYKAIDPASLKPISDLAGYHSMLFFKETIEILNSALTCNVDTATGRRELLTTLAFAGRLLQAIPHDFYIAIPPLVTSLSRLSNLIMHETDNKATRANLRQVTDNPKYVQKLVEQHTIEAIINYLEHISYTPTIRVTSPDNDTTIIDTVPLPDLSIIDEIGMFFANDTIQIPATHQVLPPRETISPTASSSTLLDPASCSTEEWLHLSPARRRLRDTLSAPIGLGLLTQTGVAETPSTRYVKTHLTPEETTLYWQLERYRTSQASQFHTIHHRSTAKEGEGIIHRRFTNLLGKARGLHTALHKQYRKLIQHSPEASEHQTKSESVQASQKAISQHNNTLQKAKGKWLKQLTILQKTFDADNLTLDELRAQAAELYNTYDTVSKDAAATMFLEHYAEYINNMVEEVLIQILAYTADMDRSEDYILTTLIEKVETLLTKCRKEKLTAFDLSILNCYMIKGNEFDVLVECIESLKTFLSDMPDLTTLELLTSSLNSAAKTVAMVSHRASRGAENLYAMQQANNAILYPSLVSRIEQMTAIAYTIQTETNEVMRQQHIMNYGEIARSFMLPIEFGALDISKTDTDTVLFTYNGHGYLHREDLTDYETLCYNNSHFATLCRRARQDRGVYAHPIGIIPASYTRDVVNNIAQDIPLLESIANTLNPTRSENTSATTQVEIVEPNCTPSINKDAAPGLSVTIPVPTFSTRETASPLTPSSADNRQREVFPSLLSPKADNSVIGRHTCALQKQQMRHLVPDRTVC